MSDPQRPLDTALNTALPVASATQQPARRLSRVALGIALLLGALLVTMGALVITSPPARSPLHGGGPRDQRPAEAAFLNNPPRHAPSSSAQREEERIANLLRLARQAQASPSGPLALGEQKSLEPVGPGEPPAGRAPQTPGSPESPYLNSLGDEGPPQGAYRPYITPVRQPLAAPTVKPSWQAAFASSLTSQTGASPTGTSLDSAPPQLSPAAFQFPGLPPFPSAPPPAPAADLGEKTQEALSSPTSPQRRLVRPTASPGWRRALPAGTVLNAILLTAVSTEMPGDAVAHVTSDILAVDGSILLPRGARLVGSYRNRVALGENRIAIAWDRLQVGGRSYDIPGLASTSPDGAAGLPGDVNNHTALVFGRAALLSLIGAGAQLGQPSQSRLGASLSSRELIAGSVSQQLSQAANEYLNRAVNVTPTLTIPAGARVTVLLPYDLELPSR
jgi:type IV secretory pathway VirB10-like protein